MKEDSTGTVDFIPYWENKSFIPSDKAVKIGYYERLQQFNPDFSQLEESAIPVVSELLNEQYGDQAAKCLKVEIIEQVTDKHYKAVATLSNGEDMNIMIEDRGDQIYVTIPLE